MAESLPETGKFKIQTVGPIKTGTSKKGNAWRAFSLQFEGDSTWYDTFWMPKEDPEVGGELSGTKSYDDQFKSYKFEVDRNGGGKNNWNPAGAQATVMHAAASTVTGFLAIPEHYKLWVSDAPEDAKQLKKLFDKYIATVEAVGKRMKDSVVGMGSMQPQQQAGATKTSGTTDGDPGPTPPPEIETWPEGEEEVQI